MGNRKTIHRVVTVAGVAATALTLSASRAAASAPGEVELPAGISAVHSNAELTLTWVFRDEYAFACETAAYDLRRLMGEYGNRLDVTAIGIDTDPELVASFLRRERLSSIPVQPYTEAFYRQVYGTEANALVFISRGGQRVRSVLASNGPQTGQQVSVGLYEAVVQLLARPAHTVARAQ